MRNSSNPDKNAEGLLKESPEALRYERQSIDSLEVDGIILAEVPQGAKLLDVGCGTGCLTETIRNLRSATAIGIEPQVERAERARLRGIEIVAEELSLNLLSEYGPFDVILFADVLEHVVNPRQMLVTAANGLHLGGVIVASVPNVAHWTVRLNLLFGRFDYQPSGIMDVTHLRWFTLKNILHLFKDAGYVVEKITPTAGYWMPEYHQGFCRVLPGRVRRVAVGLLARLLPALFACQFVVRARVSDSTCCKL